MLELLVGCLALTGATWLLAELEPEAHRMLGATAVQPELRAAAALRWLLLWPVGASVAAVPAWAVASYLGIPWRLPVACGLTVWSAAWTAAAIDGIFRARRARRWLVGA